ncbi:unnamed protein product [Vicia faba]|uniref:Uncharacterized protein n=1 Tax=Vicia faba TaxID=3906 RepID=A0AAV0ZAJ7_VICFA|nr:unnamed protein product [Vicia faba]
MAKLDLMAEMAFNMYRGASLSSLVAVGCGKVFEPSNPSKERELLEGQSNLVLHDRNYLQDKLTSLEKYTETHNVPSELALMVSSPYGILGREGEIP